MNTSFIPVAALKRHSALPVRGRNSDSEESDTNRLPWRGTRWQRECCISRSWKTGELHSTFREIFSAVVGDPFDKGELTPSWVRKRERRAFDL